MTQEPDFQQVMNEYFEKNKPPTLKERFEEYLATKVDWAQSYHVTANELVDIAWNQGYNVYRDILMNGINAFKI